MYIFRKIYLERFIYVNMYTRIHVYMYICTNVHLQICLNVSMYICTYVYVYVYVYIYICMHSALPLAGLQAATWKRSWRRTRPGNMVPYGAVVPRWGNHGILGIELALLGVPKLEDPQNHCFQYQVMVVFDFSDARCYTDVF